MYQIKGEHLFTSQNHQAVVAMAVSDQEKERNIEIAILDPI